MLSVLVDLHILELLGIIFGNFVELRALVGDCWVLPCHFLALHVEVIELSQVLIEMLLPTLWQLYPQIARLHFLYAVVYLQAYFVPLAFLVPLDHGRFLPVEPSCRLALQATNLHCDAVWDLSLGHLFVFLGVPLNQRRIHEIVFSQLHDNRIVSAALKLNFVPVYICFVVDDLNELAVIIWLALDSNNLHDLTNLEYRLLQRLLLLWLPAAGHERVIACVGQLLVAILHDLSGMLGERARLNLSFAAVPAELVVLVAFAALFHERPPWLAPVFLKDHALEDLLVRRLMHVFRSLLRRLYDQHVQRKRRSGDVYGAELPLALLLGPLLVRSKPTCHVSVPVTVSPILALLEIEGTIVPEHRLGIHHLCN
mmetsp:Transcript_165/g.511  ORF Transcript_165/g.511 Transcript_165/m.511 type:complete len:369 (-) Transcript_165:134-1240(-)